jgi:hypothetical protein
MKLNLILETNFDVLFQNNLITSITLKILSYNGFQIEFNGTQIETLWEIVTALRSSVSIIQSQITVTQLLLDSEQLDLLIESDNQLSKVLDTLALLYNTSSSTVISNEANIIVAVITNFTATLQLLGKISNYSRYKRIH